MTSLGNEGLDQEVVAIQQFDCDVAPKESNVATGVVDFGQRARIGIVSDSACLGVANEPRRNGVTTEK